MPRPSLVGANALGPVVQEDRHLRCVRCGPTSDVERKRVAAGTADPFGDRRTRRVRAHSSRGVGRAPPPQERAHTQHEDRKQDKGGQGKPTCGHREACVSSSPASGECSDASKGTHDTKPSRMPTSHGNA